MPLGAAAAIIRRNRVAPPANNPLAVSFDGASYATRGADLTGSADGQAGTAALWIRTPASMPSVNARILANTGDRLSIQLTTGGNIRFLAFSTASAVCLDLRTSALSTNTTYAILASWNLAGGNSANSDVYVNDVSDKSVSTFADATIDYTRTNWGLGAADSGVAFFTGDLADLWLSIATRIDFSVEANRRLFFTTANCVQPKGSDGSDVGVTPIAFFSDTDVANWHLNKGIGGGFTIQAGTLTEAAMQPCWG